MTLLLTWQLPSLKDRYGIIQQYTINITEVETGALQHLIAEGTILSVSPLHPFYTYNCSIAAETSVGLGPFSNPQTVQMPEDGRLVHVIELAIIIVDINNTLFPPSHHTPIKP